MPLLFWVVPYIIAGGVMWFVASQMAPVGREIRFSLALWAVFLMGICGELANYFLRPMIGPWVYLAEFLVWAILVMVVLRLPFKHSLIAVAIYLGVLVAAVIGMRAVAKSGAWVPKSEALNPEQPARALLAVSTSASLQGCGVRHPA